MSDEILGETKMKDEFLDRIKIIYQKLGKEDKFEEDIKNGVIARVNLTKHNNNTDFFLNYAALSSSIEKIGSDSYQWFVFRNGYCYKNDKLIDVKYGRTLTPSSNPIKSY